MRKLFLIVIILLGCFSSTVFAQGYAIGPNIPTPSGCTTGLWQHNTMDGISFSVGPNTSGSPANTFPSPCEWTLSCYTTFYETLVTNPNSSPVKFNAFIGVSNPYDFAAPMWPYIGVDYSDTNWTYIVPANGTLALQLFREECPIAATYTVSGQTCTIPAPTAPLIPNNANTAGQCNIAQCGNSGTCGTGVPYESPEVVNLDTTTTDSALSITMNAFQVVGMPMFTSEIQK